MFLPKIPIRSIMSSALVMVPSDAPLATVRAKMREHRIRHLIVFSSMTSLAGIVSVNDLAAFDPPAGLHRDLGTHTAADVMTVDPLTLRSDDSVGLAAELFLSRTLHALPVVDDGELVGIVTSHDLLQHVYGDILSLRA